MHIVNSLKTRILVFIGGVVILLMMVISVSVLYQWRALILADQRESAELVTRAFSVTILDALILRDSGLLQSEGYLENYIRNFLKKNRQVKFVIVYDQHQQLVVSSDLNADPKTPGKPTAPTLLPRSSIYQHPDYGWLSDATLPLRISGKTWGTLTMGFDAEPSRNKIKKLFFFLFGLTLLMVFAVLGVLYFLINNLTRSLSNLVSEIDKFDLGQDSPVQMKIGNDEIGFLVRHFEKMKQRLAHSQKQLIHAQKQIYQAEKLASIGRLASGIAHEINNPLNGIKNCLYSIKRDPKNLTQTQTYLELVNEGLEHIEQVVQKLLGFARQKSKSIAPVDLNQEIEKVLTLLNYRLDQQRIQIELALDPILPRIHADGQLLQEVVMNLLLNSFDSVRENGKITIKTAAIDRHQISIEISDNGAGIPPEHLDQIFDPFFTTKEEGRGTGLGLSVSLGIIEAHGGRIAVKSQPHAKTSFQIILPIQASPLDVDGN
jgi:signal transduction histidine kinase